MANALDWRLRLHGLLATAPPAIRDFADGAATLARQRADAQMRQTRQILDGLSAAGIDALPLKGSATLILGLYPDRGARFCSDIDILVPAAQLARSWAVLIAAGYRPMEAGGPGWPLHAKHAPRLAHPRQPMAVELHQHLADGSLARALPGREMLERAAPRTTPGGPVRLACPQDMALHCLCHMIGDWRRDARLSLRQLLELRLLLDVAGAGIDWPDWSRRLTLARERTAFLLLLTLTGAITGWAWPPGLPRPSRRIRLLARLHHPGISASGPGRWWLHAVSLSRALQPDNIARQTRQIAAAPRPLAALRDKLATRWRRLDTLR